MNFLIKGVLKKDELESREIYYVIEQKEVFKVKTNGNEPIEIQIPKIIAKKGLIKEDTPIEIKINVLSEIELKLKDKLKNENNNLLKPKIEEKIENIKINLDKKDEEIKQEQKEIV